MSSAEDYAKQARDFVTFYRHGVLSTISVSQLGYPFGSIVPYDMTQDSSLVIYVSLIAEHYKNLVKDKRASITVCDAFSSHDPQASARATILLNFLPVPESEIQSVQSSYEGRFPNSVSYELSHNFVFMRGKPERVRWIGGFGDIAWVDARRFCSVEPDLLAYSGMGIVQHMNQDHADALRDIIAAFDRPLKPGTHICMVSVASDGFVIAVYENGKRRDVRIAFPERVKDPAHARGAMIKLVTEARQRAKTRA